MSANAYLLDDIRHQNGASHHDTHQPAIDENDGTYLRQTHIEFGSPALRLGKFLLLVDCH